MQFKSIQIILPLVIYALLALSSPIHYDDNLNIDEYIPNEKETNEKLLVVRNEISEEVKILFSVEDSDKEEEIIIEGNDELMNNDSDSESEEESKCNDKFSDVDYLSYNWNRTPEELKSIAEEEFEDKKKIIAQIENIPDEECSFESIIVPLEQKVIGPIYEKIDTINSLQYYHPDESIREMSSIINSNFTVYENSIYLNKNIYHKVLMIKENIKNGLFAEPEAVEDKRLIDVYELKFRERGIDIPDEKAEEYLNIVSEINLIVSKIIECAYTENAIISFKKEELEGIPNLENFEKTEENGEEIYKIGLDHPNYGDIYVYSKNENTRKKAYNAMYQICPSNIDLMKNYANLKLKKAKILGYSSNASYVLENRLAKSPENVMEFLQSLKEKTKSIYDNNIKKELLEIKKKEKDELKEPFDNKINFWDYNYYLRILNEINSVAQESEFMEYFPLNEVLEGIINHFETVFSFKFVKVKNPSVWNPEVLAFNVYDKSTKKLIGVIYLDLFTRPGKYINATSTFTFRYEREDGSYSIPATIVLLGLNPPQLSNKPTLFSAYDLKAIIHEFGHAIHFISANVKWTTYKSYDVEFEFMEVTSQFNENWIREPEFLLKLSHHYQDSTKKIPKELLDGVLKTQNYKKPNEILFKIVRSIADMKINSITEEDENLDVSEVLNKEIEDSYDIELDKDFLYMANFPHWVTYDVGIYSYLWSEVYSTDLFYSQFKKYGIFNPEVGKRYRKIILEKGSSENTMNLMIEFLGREPNDEAFIKSISYEY